MTIKTDAIVEYTTGSGVTIDGLLIKDGAVQGVTALTANTISEANSGVGVTVDGVLLKDGGAVVAGAITPSTDNTLALGDATADFATAYVRNLMSLSKFGTNVLFVDPKGTGTYTTLSAALAAITDASTSNEYLIVVAGEVAETTVVTAKSHVHVLFLAGASVTITSTATVNGVNFTSLSNTTWTAVDSTRPHIIRAGVVGGSSFGVYLSSVAATVALVNLYVQNVTTGAGDGTGIYYVYGYANMLNCTGTGGAGGSSCHGIYLNGVGSGSKLTNCTGIGGAGGSSCHGIYSFGSATLAMTNCTGIGGAGGANCYGVYNHDKCAVVMTNSTGIGGAGGATGHGIYNRDSHTEMVNCVGIGGAGGTGCYGIYNFSGSFAIMRRCTGIGGSGGTGCYGISNTDGSGPAMVDCIGYGGGAYPKNTLAAVTASARTENAFRPTASYPYRLIGITINVTAAAAGGVTLTMRDATGGGGNALTGAMAVDTTGKKQITVTGHRYITAGNYLYARLSAEDATLAYTACYVYEHCAITCYGLYHDSVALTRIDNCTFISNAASEAVYVTANGDDATIFIGGTARSGLNSGTREKAFVCAASWSPGQVYNMVLDGGSTNLTAAAGTANGSNIEL